MRYHLEPLDQTRIFSVELVALIHRDRLCNAFLKEVFHRVKELWTLSA